jgi:hypothetical protein
MESPVANSLAAITVGLLALSMRNRRWLVVAGIAAGLFAISRVEFVVHAAPLLLVAAIYLRARGGTLREMASLLTPAVVIWVAVLAIRFTYFGSLTPNSALEPFTADPLSPGASLAAWAKPALPIAIAVAYFVIRLFKRGSSSASAIVRSPSFIAVALIGAIASVLLAVRLASSDALPNVDAVRDSFHALGLGGWLLVAAALIALVGLRHLNIVAILLGTQVLTGVGSLLIFGGARLSPERVVTFVLVPLLSLIALQLLYVDARSFRIRGIGVHRATVVSVAIVALLGGTGWLFSTRDAIVSTRELCCDRTRVSSRVLATAAQLRRDTGLPTVSVASADLGYLSLQKAVNVTDLGWLGDPVLTKLWHEGNVTGTHRAAVTYLNDYVVPDVVELHPGWACTYANWQRSKAFQTRYRLVWDDAQTADWLNSSCPGAVGLKGGIWVRRDLSDGRANREAALSRVLARSPSPRRVRKELSTCMAAGQSDACQYVARSVYRNLRAFEDAGTLDETRRAFMRSPSAQYDQALLNSRSQADWAEQASDFLRLRRPH